MPSAFKQTFRSTLPELFYALRKSAIKEEGRVAWGDIEGWMWTLFSEQWAELRQMLQSSLYPFISPSEDICYLPPPTPVLYLFSENVAPRPGFWPGELQKKTLRMDHLRSICFDPQATPSLNIFTLLFSEQ